MISIAAEPLDSADARRLIGELDAHLKSLYPPEENFLELPVADVFLVARADGDAIGCGAVRFLDATTAEIKRMYVAPDVRGSGVARQILTQLEAFARDAGAARLVLETGIRQEAAIVLYERFGFAPIPCFGAYAASPSSRCYEKRLSP